MAKQFIHQFDAYFISIIRKLPQDWHPMFAVLTHIGHPITVLIIAAVIAVGARTVDNARLLIASSLVPLTLLVGAIIKVVFGRTRPLGDYVAMMRFDTYSFPSGHATGAMIAFGLLALMAWHYLPQPWSYVSAVLCVFIIIFVGVSRIYLGAHFPSDVLAGWILGMLALLLIVFVVKPFGTQ